MRTGRHIHCHRWRSASISDKCLSPSASPSPQTSPFDIFPIRELENRKIRWEVFTNKGGGVPPVIGKIPWKWVPSSFILLTFIAKTYRGQRPILQNILLCAGVSAIITRILYRKSKIKVIQWYFQSKTVTMVELKVDIPSNVKPFRQYICQVPENNSFGFFSPGGPRTICGDVDQSKTLSNTPLIGHYFCAKILWHSYYQFMCVLKKIIFLNFELRILVPIKVGLLACVNRLTLDFLFSLHNCCWPSYLLLTIWGKQRICFHFSSYFPIHKLQVSKGKVFFGLFSLSCATAVFEFSLSPPNCGIA